MYMCVYVYMYVYAYTCIYLVISECIHQNRPKKTTNSKWISQKKTFKIEHFNPTPPPAKMIKCMRSDAMRYESDSELMDKVIKTNPAS